MANLRAPRPLLQHDGREFESRDVLALGPEGPRCNRELEDVTSPAKTAGTGGREQASSVVLQL